MAEPPELPDAFRGRRLSSFRTRLRKWFRESGRALPWRQTRDPYRIWLSEIMLQQTTVAAVIPYFERFIERFPDIEQLAAASEQDVLQVWEGLGYYSRARSIHRAARALVATRSGTFPREIAELEALPGIGRYTAGAIRSFAFNLPAPIVEANTLRLYARLLGYQGDCRTAAGQRLLWQFAETVVPQNDPGEINQALMELGATVCLPAEPRCGRCPIATSCRAREAGTVGEIPRLPPRPAVTPLTEAAVVIERHGKFLIRQCADGERWAGLWDFPRVLVQTHAPTRERVQWDSSTRPESSFGTIEAQMWNDFEIPCRVQTVIRELRHSVTRYRIRLWCVAASLETDAAPKASPWKWCTPEHLSEVPLSVSGRKIANLLGESVDNRKRSDR